MSPKIHSQAIDHPEIAAAVAGLVSVVLHYSGDNPLSPHALGIALTALALPVVMFVVRTIARLVSKQTEDEAGFSRISAILLILVMSVAWLCMGCGSNYHLKTGGMKITKTADGQTCAQIFGDGDADVARVCFKVATIKVPAGACHGSE